ncbi:MAG: PEP-CTERM sorting domain-containing protein [Verrucomicrobiales bacterium]
MLGFTNLNFEDATLEINDPTFGFLDWDLAAPGWEHSSGSSTGIIYYENIHLGADQAFLLRDRTSPMDRQRALSGNYSLSFVGGFDANDPADPYIDAFIAQTGDVPGDARSVQMLARGPFDVFLAGTQIPMMDLGGGLYGGNIAGFAGGNSELRIVNTTGEDGNEFTIVDDIVFSPMSVPEPNAPILLLLGGLVATCVRRRA